MKTIMLDVDGVLADFVLAFTTLGNKMFGAPILHTADQQSWSFQSMGLFTADQEAAMWRIVREDNWWQTLCPLVSLDTFARINLLHRTYNVLFVTNRPSDIVPAQLQTKLWLENRGIYKPSVIVSKNKGEIAKAVSAVYSIEDKLENAWMIRWLHPDCQSYLLDRPYNRIASVPAVGANLPRVQTVDEWLDIVEGGLQPETLAQYEARMGWLEKVGSND